MKKVLVLAIVALMVLAVAVTAQATETSWRIKVVADNGSGTNSSAGVFGLGTTSNDGSDSQDIKAAYVFPPGGDTAAMFTSTIVGQTDQFSTNIMGGITSPASKIWNFSLYGLANATYNNLRLRFYSAYSTALPVTSFGGNAYEYVLTLKNNQGKAGAPANDSTWILPVSTTYSSTVSWFDLSLPIAKVTTSDGAHATEGYQFEIAVRPVPEPGSLMALGTGLTGLLGFAIRRRRA